jgi:hypothetical protein
MSQMTVGGPGLRVDSRGEVDETEQIQVPTELDRSDEARRTRHWRLDQFVALGFDFVSAAIMADDARIDLGQARRLVASGCPLETASRILLWLG